MPPAVSVTDAVGGAEILEQRQDQPPQSIPAGLDTTFAALGTYPASPASTLNPSVTVTSRVTVPPGVAETVSVALYVLRAVPVNSKKLEGALGTGDTLQHPEPQLVGTAYRQVSTSGMHTCAIREAPRTLECWGDNGQGEIGRSPSVGVLDPVPVGTSEGWETVGTGAEFSCGLHSSGSLECWGRNYNGQLGDGTTVMRPDPRPVASVAGGTRWTGLAVGAAHACGLRDDASLWCWGYNAGRLGDGTSIQRSTPVSVAGTWSAVFAGDVTTCGIALDGELYCWGAAPSGAPYESRSTPQHVTGWGTGWTGVAIGTGLLCAWQWDGTADCWGENGLGELGTGISDTATSSSTLPFGVARVAVAGHSACAVTSAGELRCWGSNEHGNVGIGTIGDKRSPARVEPTMTFSAVAITDGWSCAVSGGKRYCAGSNSGWNLGDGTQENAPRMSQQGTETDWETLSIAPRFGCGFRTGNALYCWGSSTSGALQSLASPVTVPALLGTAGAWKQVAVTGGDVHAIRADDGLESWGANMRGQLGNGTVDPSNVPTAPTGGGAWSSVAAFSVQDGYYAHACAIRTDGHLFCWGWNESGQLGIDSISDVHDPVQVGTSDGWTKVAAGVDVTCGIQSAKLWCWGQGIGTTPQPVMPGTDFADVALGYDHRCAITTGGTLYCWGNNPYGGVGDGTGTGYVEMPAEIGTGFTAISLGYFSSCGLRNGGELWCWGYNAHGELGDGTGYYPTPMLVALPSP